MLYSDKVKMLSTLENAQAYDVTDEKFIFCADLLEISANHPHVDVYVDALEVNFEELLDPIDREDSELPDDAFIDESVWIETRNVDVFVVWHTGTPIKCYNSLTLAQKYVNSL